MILLISVVLLSVGLYSLAPLEVHDCHTERSMDIIQDYDESQLGVAHTLIVDGKYYTNTQFKGYITPCVRAFHESLKLRDARGGRQLHASSHVMMIGFQTKTTTDDGETWECGGTDTPCTGILYDCGFGGKCDSGTAECAHAGSICMPTRSSYCVDNPYISNYQGDFEIPPGVTCRNHGQWLGGSAPTCSRKGGCYAGNVLPTCNADDILRKNMCAKA